MIRQPISFASKIGLGVVSVVVLLAAYEFLAYRQTAENPDQTSVPSISSWGEGWHRISKANDRSERWLWQDIKATYGRLFIGLGAGVVLSVVIGAAMGAYTWIEALLAPPISFLAKIPPTAMLAVYFVVFGTSTQFYVAMVGLSVFFTLAQSIYQAAKKDVSDDSVYKAYTLGASSMEVIYEVLWKQIVPRVIESIRLQIGPAMVFLIAAEYAVGGDAGMGYRIRLQQRILHMDVVYIYLIILGASGLLMDWTLTLLRRKWCPWFGE
jgi:NitT/TauT family transport system permease protein